jgi:hypothetical protein
VHLLLYTFYMHVSEHKYGGGDAHVEVTLVVPQGPAH